MQTLKQAPSLEHLHAAADVVYAHMPPTPQFCWPLLCERLGTEVWLKHENHTPIGAFKVRGGLHYMHKLKAEQPDCPGVITATRGNHGQSVALAGKLAGIATTVLVPKGNNPEKNAAMRAFGAELIEHGDDFQAAREYAGELGTKRGLTMLGPFHPDLVLGVASYSLEFFANAPDLDVVFVPIGMGSGICSMIWARDALGLKTRIIGVVADGAPAYRQSFTSGSVTPTNSADTIADGVACRVPDADALAIIMRGADDVIAVSDATIMDAMAALFVDTHNMAEGAGAIGLAGALSQRVQLAGKRVGLVLSGGNVDAGMASRVLARAHGQINQGDNP